MSVKASHLERLVYFYPAGNTPAVYLTQNISTDQDASLLLLGYGDIRNILFTLYAKVGQAEMIARNAIALTAILDGGYDNNLRLLWNIYHLVRLDVGSCLFLQNQATKLLSLAGSLDEWRSGPYRHVFQFCDTATLASVAKLWELYAIRSADTDEFKKRQHFLREQYQAAQIHKDHVLGNNKVVNKGTRAFALLIEQGFKEGLTSHTTYWKSGTTLAD
ncbi:hypothetical protein BCR34DRAFT_604807 [Clohesyomyces aquaticus]|uniref:DUF4470 domain-containing protein n=1 Tax=Clohesyomyces aquaticus TaxID=1231657 RepID=A0A1Y1Z365_9PLEO|nr:hypothetical protein BCR34DRAFT_604807 [Clohesyomyces aquaticus]